MSKTTHEVPERIVPFCVEALENYQQADMDGIMVLVSRQAIHETIDAYWARVKTCDELGDKLAQAVEVLREISKTSMGECGCYYTNRLNIKRARAFLATIQPEGEPDNGS